jgi:hypothetical protein
MIKNNVLGRLVLRNAHENQYCYVCMKTLRNAEQFVAYGYVHSERPVSGKYVPYVYPIFYIYILLYVQESLNYMNMNPALQLCYFRRCERLKMV